MRFCGLEINSLPRDFPGGPGVKTSLSSAEGAGSIPGQGSKTPHISQPKDQNIKQKQYYNNFRKDFLKKWSTLSIYIYVYIFFKMASLLTVLSGGSCCGSLLCDNIIYMLYICYFS